MKERVGNVYNKIMSEPDPKKKREPLPQDLPTLIQEGDSGEKSAKSNAPRTHAVEPQEVGQPEAQLPTTPLSRVNDYEILAEIGRGGMGVVFKARDVRLDRIVALKMLSGGLLASPDDLQRFETEASAAAQLHHPNIVGLFDVGSYESQPYFSMEFVAGVSLAQRVDLGVLPSRLAASYIERTARAVHFAHSKGVIHRDLKPANVLLDESEQPKITDFGLAKLVRRDSGQTRTGTVVGTPSYMAPEQANAEKGVSGAVDVYSLGAILYELITGNPPFLAETALFTLQLVANKEPVPPRLANPKVDRDLETICLKCLEKEPSRRYPSAEALADDLRRYLKGETIGARRVGPIGRLVKWARRKPAAAAMLAIALTALFGFGVFEWNVAATERLLREEAELQRKNANTRERLLRHFFYLGQMQQAQHAWQDADLKRAIKLLNAWNTRKGQQDLRGWEWHYLNSLCGGNRTIDAHTGRVTSVAYSPDGSILATSGGMVGRPGEVKLWDRASGKLLRTLAKRHRNVVSKVAFHPDGKRLATASDDGTVRLWYIATGKESLVLGGHGTHVTSVAFSRDGKRLVSAAGDGCFQLWDLLQPGKPLRICQSKGHGSEITAVDFSPGGKLFATASLDETVRLWDAKTGKEVRVLRGQGEVMSVAFSPNGKTLVSGGGPGLQRGRVTLWDVTTGDPLRTHHGLSDRILSVAVDKQGRIAAGGSDGMVQIWDRQRSSEALRFRADVRLVYAIALSPDGNNLATGGTDGRVRIWNSSGGTESLRLPAQPRIETVAFSPTGKILASAGRSPSDDGNVTLWDAATGDKVTTLTGHAGQVRDLAFSPEGKRLASVGVDQTVRLYDLTDVTRPKVLKGHHAPVLAVVFHPDGNLLATADDMEAIVLWDTASGKKLAEIAVYNGALDLAFSRDGRYLAAGGYDKIVRVWEIGRKNGAKTIDISQAQELRGHTSWINAVAFSPKDSFLASAGKDQAIHLWDVAKGKEDGILDGATRPITGLAFHPDGRRLVSVGEDRLVRIWDLAMSKEILQIGGAGGVLQSVAFDPAGWRLAAAGDYTGVCIWDAGGRK